MYNMIVIICPVVGDKERVVNMDKKKVKLNICGTEYFLSTDEDPKYMLEIGYDVDEKLEKILRENPRISITQAAVLAALEFADAEKKAIESADKLRSNIQGYLEDSAKARMDCEIATREADRLTKELESLKAKLNSKNSHDN